MSTRRPDTFMIRLAESSLGGPRPALIWSPDLWRPVSVLRWVSMMDTTQAGCTDSALASTSWTLTRLGGEPETSGSRNSW